MTRPVPLLIALIALSALTSITACTITIDDAGFSFADWSRPKIRGNGVRVQTEHDLDAFEAIRVEGSFDAHVRVGEPHAVVLNGDENILPHVEFEVRNGLLTIGMERGSYNWRTPLTVEISVPALTRFEISGSCDASIEDLDADLFTASISGSGDLRATGRVHELDLRISGSGDMHLADVEAVMANVSISGSGDVFLSVRDSIDARVSGSGDIRYHGHPECSLRVSGSGAIKAID